MDGTINKRPTERLAKVKARRLNRMVGDPTEGSILVAALKAGAAVYINQIIRAAEIPFDSAQAYGTIHNIVKSWQMEKFSLRDNEKTTGTQLPSKAPDVVLELCRFKSDMENNPVELTAADREEILAANNDMTSRALRVLGVAYRPVPEMPSEITSEALEKDLIFVGLIGMIDPSRPEVKPALEEAQTAGIRSVMITGDYPNTAKAR